MTTPASASAQRPPYGGWDAVGRSHEDRVRGTQWDAVIE